jgi:cardiolipin synthase
MTKVIAVPVSVGSATIYAAKGRRWSIVEHLLLDAVRQEPRGAMELATLARLPVRVIVEAMINLMRVGWVELVAKGANSVFAATRGGRANVDRDELPVVTRLIRRPVRYAVDAVSGTVLRYRDLDFIWASRFRNMQDQVDAVIATADNLPQPNQIEAIASMLHDDEEYRGIVTDSARIGEGFALVRVANGKVLGLPNAPDSLMKEILAVAAKKTSLDKPERVADVRIRTPRFGPRRVSFSSDDLILGGPEHKALLEGLIRNAAASIAIHSTFVGGGKSSEMLDHLEAAARRGVRIDILWGKSDAPDGSNATREACEGINQRMRMAGLEQFVRAHPFSTESHAKIAVADDGSGGFVAALGSCNWLSTAFTSFEASLRTNDPFLVSDIMGALSQTAVAATGLNSGIAAQLSGQAINIRKRNAPHPGQHAEARLLLGSEHANYVLQARDDARSHIVLGSHRMGRSANNLSIRPTRAAVDEHGIDAVIYYGRLSDGMTADQAAALKLTHHRTRFRIRQICDPRMHAKFVAWDDENVVITSHNLLSADPIDDFAELGIHVHAAGAGRRLREKIQWAFEPDAAP